MSTLQVPPRTQGLWRQSAPAGLLALAVTAVLLAAGQPETKPAAAPRFERDIQAFEEWDRKNSYPADAVLFVGSSSIRMWPTRECFPDLPVINRGFGGAYASEVLDFADRIVLPYKPPVIVFYAGDNDIADNKKPAQVRDDFVAFVKHVHAVLPRTRIIYISIKPSVARWKHWPQMQAANTLLRAACEFDPRLSFVDIAPTLLNADGDPRPDRLAEDGLHLNAAGYDAWTKLLRPVIAKAMER